MFTPLARCPLSQGVPLCPFFIACNSHSIRQLNENVKTILEAVNNLLRKIISFSSFFSMKAGSGLVVLKVL